MNESLGCHLRRGGREENDGRMKDECFEFSGFKSVISKLNDPPSRCHGCIFCASSLNTLFSFHLSSPSLAISPSPAVPAFASSCPPSASFLSSGGALGPVAGRLTDLQLLLASRLQRKELVCASQHFSLNVLAASLIKDGSKSAR